MVFYFTATGNSLYVAKCIDENPVSIPQAIKNSSIYSDNQIGIVCPVYCGEIPNTVKEFLKESKFDTKYIYLILTYGNSASDCPEFTYNEFKALGINFDYIDTVHCVDNYLPVFDMAEEKKIDKDTDVQIAHILSATKWSTSSVHTLTAITVRVLPFFTLFITDIFARQAKRNLLSLQLMFGVFQKTAK